MIVSNGWSTSFWKHPFMTLRFKVSGRFDWGVILQCHSTYHLEHHQVSSYFLRDWPSSPNEKALFFSKNWAMKVLLSWDDIAIRDVQKTVIISGVPRGHVNIENEFARKITGLHYQSSVLNRQEGHFQGHRKSGQTAKEGEKTVSLQFLVLPGHLLLVHVAVGRNTKTAHKTVFAVLNGWVLQMVHSLIYRLGLGHRGHMLRIRINIHLEVERLKGKHARKMALPRKVTRW